MDCSNCGKPGTIAIPYENKSLCDDCFCRSFEKRVLNTLRGHLPSNGRIGFDVSTLGGRVAFHVIEPLAVKARNKCLESEKGVDLFIVGDTLDDEAISTVKIVIEGKLEKEKSKLVKPLARCLESEVKAYARIRGIESPSQKKASRFDTILREELDLVEEKHLSTKFALFNSKRYLVPLFE